MRNKIFTALALFIVLCSLIAKPTQTGSIVFTPPNGWKMAEDAKLPQSVKVMVVGTGEREFPPLYQFERRTL